MVERTTRSTLKGAIPLPKLIGHDDPFADCDGCFLRERTGGVCPMVRGSSAQSAPDSAVLYAAMLEDAGTVPSFTELVCRDAVHTGALPAAMVFSPDLSLAYSVHPDPPKEVPDALAIRVAIPARTSR
jgi:hypothetical protein